MNLAVLEHTYTSQGNTTVTASWAVGNYAPAANFDLGQAVRLRRLSLHPQRCLHSLAPLVTLPFEYNCRFRFQYQGAFIKLPYTSTAVTYLYVDHCNPTIVFTRDLWVDLITVDSMIATVRPAFVAGNFSFFKINVHILYETLESGNQ